MRNPPITRAIVADRFGDVLFDSAEPRYGQRFSVELSELARLRKPETAAIRLHLDELRAANPAAPSRMSGYILGALAVACALIGAAIAWGAVT